MKSDIDVKFKKRMWRVVLSKTILADMGESEMRAIFSVLYPISIESRSIHSIDDHVWYYAYSPMFREVKEGEVVPEYVLTVTRQHEHISITAKEKT